VANDRPPDGEPPARQPGYRPPENRPAPAPEPAEPSASRISVDVSPRYIRLQPGEVVTASIKVRNMGAVVDEITLTPRGEAGAWVTIAPDTLNIYPSTEAEATIRFAPPRASRPPAGLFAYEIAVNSDRQPASSLVYRGSVELGAYDNLIAAATGTTYLSGRRDAILPIKIRNQGNRPTNVAVSAADLPGATVSLSAPAFALEPGGEATVWATIRPRSGFMSGPPRQFPFTISVSSDYSAPLTIDGRMEQQARFSRRRLVAIAVLGAVALTVAGGFIANAFGLLPLPGASPTPSGISVVTPSPTAGPTGSGAVETATPATQTGQPTGEPTEQPTASEEPTEPPTPTPDPYLGWTNVGGEFSQGPAVVTTGANQLTLFAPWSDKTLYTSSGDGTTFSDWQPLGGPQFTTDNRPAAIVWSDPASSLGTLFNVFAVGEDDVLYQQSIQQGTQPSSEWQPIDNSITFSPGPAAASWGIGRLDVFVRSKQDASLQWNWSDGFGAWNGWATIGSDKVKLAPAAVAWTDPVTGISYIDVVAAHIDNRMYHLLYDNSQGWGSWEKLGDEQFSAAPAVTYSAPGQLEVFARDTDGVLQQNTQSGGVWSGWQQVTNINPVAPPGAVSWEPGRIDLFVVGDDTAMHHRWFAGGTWQP
jgi:hypothetical protein